MSFTGKSTRWLWFFCGIFLLAATTVSADDKHTRKPNFVIIMADDLGYGDIGCFGNTRIKTPHLDQLAKEGIRFLDFHSSGTVCSPTRCGLMTGRYQQRAGIPAVVSVKHKHLGMDPRETTFAEILVQSGYRTALFGKWHLGYQKKFSPIHHGFEQFRGYVSGNVDFFSHIDQSGAFDWWNQDRLEDEKGYTTHLITKHAVDFINKNVEEPFCLYLAHEAPHYPYQGPNDKAERTIGGQFKAQGSRKNVAQAYKEMVEELDTGIGQIVQVLKDRGIADNTLVWFFSDNGANQKGNNGGLRGFKGSVWEGGHRVPAVAWWPGKIKAGTQTDQLSITLDVFPTLISLAGASDQPTPKLDGVDLSATLFASNADALTNSKPRVLFWGSGNQRAMRSGKWKLLLNAKGLGKRVGLYNLETDQAETENLAEMRPKLVEQMKDAVRRWETDVGPSTFAKEVP